MIAGLSWPASECRIPGGETLSSGRLPSFFLLLSSSLARFSPIRPFFSVFVFLLFLLQKGSKDVALSPQMAMRLRNAAATERRMRDRKEVQRRRRKSSTLSSRPLLPSSSSSSSFSSYLSLSLPPNLSNPLSLSRNTAPPLLPPPPAPPSSPRTATATPSST